jgi:hypothetical protein
MGFERLVSHREGDGWNVLLVDVIIEDLDLIERFGARDSTACLNAEWPGVCW